MEKSSYMVVVMLVALLVVFAGISQAGGVMHKSGGDGKPEKHAMETVPQGSPTFDSAEAESEASLEYWEALGTGSFSTSREIAPQGSPTFDSYESESSLEFWRH